MHPELRNAAAGQKDLLPEPTDPAFELDERAHEPLRIAGQICCGAVGVLLARARKAELDQRHEGGREDKENHDMPRHMDHACQDQRQVEE